MKYIDVFILLPSGNDHNSRYSVNVQPNGLSIKLNLVWPTHFANLDTLTKKTIFLLDDTETYTQMSKKARELALSEFCVEKHISKLLDIYKKVIKK